MLAVSTPPDWNLPTLNSGKCYRLAAVHRVKPKFMIQINRRHEFAIGRNVISNHTFRRDWPRFLIATILDPTPWRMSRFDAIKQESFPIRKECCKTVVDGIVRQGDSLPCAGGQ